MPDEITIKQQRLAVFLDRHRLEGVFLWQRANFAWITGGRDNHIANNTPVGVAGIFATQDARICIANTIEAPRMKGEELAGAGIEVMSFPWWDLAAGRKLANEVFQGKRVASDSDELQMGLPPLPQAFNELRWALTAEE